MHTLWRGPALLIIIATLTACSAASVAPSSAPTAVVSPSAEPVESEPQESTPSSRLPGSCGDLLDSTDVAALMPGAREVVVSGHPLWDLAYLQVGKHSCEWATANEKEAVRFSIIPDATDRYLDEHAGFAPAPGTVSNTIGDASTLNCYDHSESGYPGHVQCFFGFIVDAYWVEGAYDASPSSLPFADVVPALEAVLQTSAQGLNTLGEPSPRWDPPQALVGDGSCASLDPSGAASAAMSSGGSSLSTTESGGPEDAGELYSYAYTLSGATGCRWFETGPGMNRFEMSAWVLAGGGWAWDLVDNGDRTPLDIPGSRDAYSRSVGNIQILVDDTLVIIHYFPEDAESRAIAGAAALLPQLPLSP